MPEIEESAASRSPPPLPSPMRMRLLHLAAVEHIAVPPYPHAAGRLAPAFPPDKLHRARAPSDDSRERCAWTSAGHGRAVFVFGGRAWEGGRQQHPTKAPCLLFLPFTMEMTGQYRAPVAPGFWEPIYAVAPRTHQFSQETTTNAAQKEPVSLGRPPSRSRARISSSVLVNEAVPTASQIVCHCTFCKEPSHRAAEGRHDS
ncbi:hypothetical protein B0H13DRAFT_2675352, partial [Mycena leptocephala]